MGVKFVPSGDILSQSEIDALLSALSTGEVSAEDIKKEEAEKKIKTYDFKRALRFSKEQIRSLTRIHENLARLLTTYFSGKLRTYVQINVASADQIPYEEFIRSIPNMTMLYLYEMQPLDGRMIVEINPNIAYAMLDRVLGGKGSSYNKIDQLTDIESKIMNGLFEESFDAIQEAWHSIIEIDPKLTNFEVNPQFIQVIAPNDTVVVISLNATIGEVSGMINFCLPHILLEPIMPKLAVSYWMQNEKKMVEPENTETLKSEVKQVYVPIVAKLGESTITVEELSQLAVGDCIQLNQRIDEPISLAVGKHPKFFVQPGIINNKRAVQILEEIREDE